MLKGGVIWDAEPRTGSVSQRLPVAAVMALERIPAGYRAAGDVSRKEDPMMIMKSKKRSAFQ